MQRPYIYREKIRHGHRNAYRRRLFFSSLIFATIAVVAGLIYIDLNRSDDGPSSTSQLGTQIISESARIFKSPYFQFSDSGNWVLKKDESNDQVYVYYKYRGLDIEHRLIIYVNQVPISLHLASGWVLPVRIVNNSTLDITSVSGHCVQQYGQSELHKVKTVTIAGAQMLCDPDTPLYSVALAEVGGDYRLDMRRSNGSPVSFVVLYRDMRLSSDPTVIERVAASFQAL